LVLGPNRRAQERERAAAEAVAKAGRAEAERKVQTDAQEIVAIWNARQAGGLCGLSDNWSSDQSRAALAVVFLTACGQLGSVDRRALDRHPGAAISSLIPSVSCRRCSPNAPFARLEMLTADRP
jgi:hypothetical protein